ncbi:DUF411 domain-containing protein [Imbroritus primus]|uniref:DUF411 domain-containing protein n=1 Tax=Imbroritus primus TaxID=3058603 RepID=UPI003D161076
MISQRRTLLQFLAASATVVAIPAFAQKAASLPVIDVYKSPSCGCCGAWIEHLQKNGFTVRAHNVDDTSTMRQKLRMPEKFGSCHTAKVGNYVLEGHVPASEVKRLLAERPAALGLAVPAMPVGSPGMEVASGRVDPYDVLLVQADGKSSVYRSYKGRS